MSLLRAELERAGCLNTRLGQQSLVMAGRLAEVLADTGPGSAVVPLNRELDRLLAHLPLSGDLAEVRSLDPALQIRQRTLARLYAPLPDGGSGGGPEC